MLVKNSINIVSVAKIGEVEFVPIIASIVSLELEIDIAA
jgi:hypothetical protein